MGTFSFLPFDLRMNKILLLLGNVFAGVCFIVLQNRGIFPLSLEHFAFFSFVMFLFALYRPAWAFLFFVGMLPYETIEIVEAGSITLRPYQWLAVLLTLSVGLRFCIGKLPFKLLRPQIVDVFPVIIFLSAGIASFFTEHSSAALKQSLVVGSFVLIYALGRVFLRTLLDIKQIIPFILSSSVVVFGYALWQNLQFLSGQNSFQVMSGRPNATFSEADWLGLFSLFIFTALSVLALFFIRRAENIESVRIHIKNMLKSGKLWAIFFLEVLTCIVLLIAVSRSAWLGIFAGFCIMWALSSFLPYRLAKEKFLSEGVWLGLMTVKVLLLSLLLVYFLHLTSFNLFQRAASTAHGLQKITVACVSDSALPEKIESMEELTAYQCRHITLEEKEAVQGNGQYVKEVFRNDPNVSIRKDTYGAVFELIKEHPIAGIGWGNAARFLGNDERGAGLNASNMFLEVWLGSGVFGFLAFVIWWIAILLAALKSYFAISSTGERMLALFVVSGVVGMSVFNFFNSGILLGFFFLFLVLGSWQVEKQAWFVKKNI